MSCTLVLIITFCEVGAFLQHSVRRLAFGLPKAGFRPAGSHRVAFGWHWANRRLACHQSKTGLRAAENTQAAQCFPSSSTTVHVMLRLLWWFAFCVARAELLNNLRAKKKSLGALPRTPSLRGRRPFAGGVTRARFARARVFYF